MAEIELQTVGRVAHLTLNNPEKHNALTRDGIELFRQHLNDIKEDREVYERCSPIYQLAEATTPVFLVHGEGRYPRSDASLKFARALEQEYKTFEYKIYPNE